MRNRVSLCHDLRVAHVERVFRKGPAALCHGTAAEGGHQLGQGIRLAFLGLLVFLQLRVLERLLQQCGHGHYNVKGHDKITT